MNGFLRNGYARFFHLCLFLTGNTDSHTLKRYLLCLLWLLSCQLQKSLLG